MKAIRSKSLHFVLFVTIAISPIIGFAQQRKDERHQPLFLPIGSIRLDSLSDWIFRESEFVLSFNAGKINPGKKIILTRPSISLDTLLSYLYKNYRLSNKVIGNHIILYGNTSQSKGQKPPLKRTKHPPVDKKDHTVEKPSLTDSVSPDAPESFMFTDLPVIKSNITGDLQFVGQPKESGEQLIMRKFPPPDHGSAGLSSEKPNAAQPSTDKENQEQGNHSKEARSIKRANQFSASAGITTSELLYVNSQVRAGLPWLFATIALGTNFRAAGISYGIGTSVRVSDIWSIRLSAENGSLSKDFILSGATPDIDTILRAKAGLIQINLLAEKHLRGRWSLQFGAVANILTTNYSMIYKSVASSFPLPPATEVNYHYYIVKPLYTFSRKYDELSGLNRAMWIGFQVGLFYNFR